MVTFVTPVGSVGFTKNSAVKAPEAESSTL
jgi:hypothetical protein